MFLRRSDNLTDLQNYTKVKWYCWLTHIFVRNANNIKKGNYCLDCGYGKELIWHSRYYCPNCKSGELFVDDNRAYMKDKPYGYFCLDCKRSFIISDKELDNL